MARKLTAADLRAAQRKALGPFRLAIKGWAFAHNTAAYISAGEAAAELLTGELRSIAEAELTQMRTLTVVHGVPQIVLLPAPMHEDIMRLAAKSQMSMNNWILDQLQERLAQLAAQTEHDDHMKEFGE